MDRVTVEAWISLEESAKTAIPKYCRLGGLSNRNVFSQFRRLDVKIKALAGWFFSEAPLLGLQLAVSSLSSHSLPSVPVSQFPLLKTTIILEVDSQ